ncbi:capsule biosynthesis protein [Siccirubricoccus sp. KC 17139]|uniref:Capsule biosynthesis protein n=1 Tax=Siccirubricoccus soli TaxID=2899147 RepID=A0ABT1DBF6_9PROT|nr:capsule biosynthesis protein [Siccirubricoccus soli]MCO6419273.1 capsule biosynthesis protein [Siccirubricoccus soli]MCP2685408.1 capsule biosynthesis protein [Siccirubricoccus soli]
MTIWTKQSPPTTLPEAGAIEAGWSGPVAAPGLMSRVRRLARRNAFKLTVLLPTLLAGLYFIHFAAPQYDSEARFLIRGRQQAPTGGLGEMLQASGFRPASEDAMGVRDYLESHDAVAALRARLPLVEMFRRPEADAVARLWWENPTAERLQDYYRRMVSVEFDTTSGITALRVRSFRAEDSKAITEALLSLSEAMVNNLNQRLQEDGLRVAREEVARAEQRLAAVQLEMTQFRERERAVDPTRSAALALENLGRLEGALAQARAEMAEAQRFTRADNPRVVQLRNRIEALNAQVAEERVRISSTDAGLSQQIGEYERLGTERELARTQLASATASLERARVDAQRQQIFLLRVVEPNLAEYARYPKGVQTTLYIFICLSVAYGLAWLLVAGMREHAS